MINPETIEEAVYNLCVEANTTLSDDAFTKILQAHNAEQNSNAKQALGLILENAKMAYEKKMPLCQDTGQVLVFVKGSAKYFPDNINDLINNAVSKAYEENFFRKSVVKNAVFNRDNSKTNTPCVIYTEIANKNELEIQILLKGAGSENVSACQMLSPTASEEDIKDFVVSAVKKAGARGCPPYFIGIGIGGTMEYAALLSKKALLLDENFDENNNNLAQRIQTAINELNIGATGHGGTSTALDVKLLTEFTHIACMPVAVTINCHSSRHAKCVINEQQTTYFSNNIIANFIPNEFDFSDFIKIKSSDTNKLKALKQGQKVLLSGEVYTARDMAHKRLVEMIKKGEKLPFDLKDKIIFYAGPCPSGKCDLLTPQTSETNALLGCVVGSIGPTTSSRMDKFASVLYQNGVLATIGKGERSDEIKQTISQTNGLYFTALGGIACYLSQKFIKKELVAFEDLGTEAIYKFEVKDLPLRLDFS